MSKDIDAKLRALVDQCNALESQAGIEARMENAREPCLPFFAGDIEPPSPEDIEDHFAWEHDHRRKKCRDVYLSVGDETLRGHLIALHRQLDATLMLSFEQDVAESEKAFELWSGNQRRHPWNRSGLWAFVGAAVGYSMFGGTGSVIAFLAGVPVGYFVGRNDANAALDEPRSKLAEHKENLLRARLMPEYFSAFEEMFADRVDNFGDESGLANVMQARRKTSGDEGSPCPTREGRLDSDA